MFLTWLKNNKKTILLTVLFLSMFFGLSLNACLADVNDAFDVSTTPTAALKSMEGNAAGGSGVGVIADRVGGASLKLVNAALVAIYKLSIVLLAISTWLLDLVISPKMFERVFFSPIAKAGITSAWSFVRDFFNLFFILVILLIALSTILGVGKFKNKEMLFKILFAALLINFSKPITLFVIDASQVFMRFFADAIGEMEIGTTLSKLVNFEKVFKGGTNVADQGGLFMVTVMSIVMVLVLVIMLFFLAISLVVRFVALWVLIILSPLAMFGFAMEGTKLGGMKDDWAKELVSWCFYGPMLLFFIWLSIFLVKNITDSIEKQGRIFDFKNSTEKLKTSEKLSDFFVTVGSMLIPYVVTIYLLFYGYDKAKSTASGAAAATLGYGRKKINELGKQATMPKTRAAIGKKMTLPGTRAAISAGVATRAEKIPVLKRFTKKGSEDAQALNEARKKRTIGGDGGAAERKYYEGKAQEKLKEWKDSPPEKEELDEMFKNGSREEKLAATLHKSKNNKLEFDAGSNDYDQAIENLGDHQGLIDEFKGKAKKENMGAVINSETRDKDWNNVGDQAEILAVYEKQVDSKTNKELFKNQNKDFFLDGDVFKPEVLKYLRDRTDGLEQDTRKRLAEAGIFKNREVYDALRGSNEGKYILGEIA